MDLRPIRREDVSACLDVFYEALEELHARLGQEPIVRNPEALGRVFQHLAGTDPQRCWLAEDGGRVVGFGMAHQRDDHWYLGFLFVLPARQSRGVGRAILERCLPPAAEREWTRLSVAVEAIQPVSTALYATYGMVPREPLYVLTGELKPDVLPDPERGLAAAGLAAMAFAALEDPAAVEAAVGELDRQVCGYARPQEHRFLLNGSGIGPFVGGTSSTPGAEPDRLGFLYRQGSQTVAYGYVQKSGRIGPICATEAAFLTPILGHLVMAVRPLGGWQAIVPGSAADALLPLLRAGLRIDGGPAVYCGSWEGPHFERYLPMNFALN